MNAPALILPVADTAPRRGQRTMRTIARRHQPTERHRWSQKTLSPSRWHCGVRTQRGRERTSGPVGIARREGASAPPMLKIGETWSSRPVARSARPGAPMQALVLAFAPFGLAVADERLWKDGTEIKLRRKPFAILKYLAMHPVAARTQLAFPVASADPIGEISCLVDGRVTTILSRCLSGIARFGRTVVFCSRSSSHVGSGIRGSLRPF
jgi:hypothetical protein